jgi:hypothetical protein
VPRVGSRCPGRASASARVLGSILSMRAIPSPAREETPAGAGWMALYYGRNLGAEGGSWPGVGRVDAEMISGRVGSTKGRTRIFAGLANSQPSGHATVGQGAERRRMARSMAPPTGGHRRVAGLTRSGSLGRGYSRRKPGMRSRSYPFRWPGSGPGASLRRSVRRNGTRTGRPGAAARNHHTHLTVNTGTSALRCLLPPPRRVLGIGGAGSVAGRQGGPVSASTGGPGLR